MESNTNFQWLNRYSNTDNDDKQGRWARLLYYKDKLITWVNRTVNVDGTVFYHIHDFYPTLLNDSPCLIETKNINFDLLKIECENRFLEFKNSL